MSNASIFHDWIGRSWGARLDADRPEGHLAELEFEHKATPDRVARARMYFPEASLDDFEARGTLGRRFLRRETGIEYMLDESQPLLLTDPTRSAIECFAIHGDRLMFLRRRDADLVTERVIHGELVAGRLVQGPDGQPQLLPSKVAP